MSRHLKISFAIAFCLIVVIILLWTFNPSHLGSFPQKETTDSSDDLEKIIIESYWGLSQIIDVVSGNRFEEVDGGEATIFHLGGPNYIKLSQDKLETIHGISLLDHWREQIEEAEKDRKHPQRLYLVREKLGGELIQAMLEYGDRVDLNNLPPLLTEVEKLRRQMLNSMKK